MSAMRRELWAVSVLVLLVGLVGCKAPEKAAETAQPPKPTEQAAAAAGKAMAPDAGKPESADAAADGMVTVVAYYPDNEGHAKIKALIEGLNAKYPGKVKAEFVDFTSDDGFKRWQGDGLSCGGILINGEQTFSYDKAGKPTEVTFKMAEGGEWTEADLHAVLDKLVAAGKAGGEKK
jgi:hypothetical protein